MQPACNRRHLAPCLALYGHRNLLVLRSRACLLTATHARSGLGPVMLVVSLEAVFALRPVTQLLAEYWFFHHAGV